MSMLGTFGMEVVMLVVMMGVIVVMLVGVGMAVLYAVMGMGVGMGMLVVMGMAAGHMVVMNMHIGRSFWFFCHYSGKTPGCQMASSNAPLICPME